MKVKKLGKRLVSLLAICCMAVSLINTGVIYAKTTKEEVPLIDRVNEAIDKTYNFILESGTYSSDWKTVALSKAGYPVPKGYMKDYLKEKEKWAKEKKCYSYKVTDYERLTLGITAAGGDPTNVAGYNLLDKIYNYHDSDKPKRQLDFQGLNGVIYGLIALDSNDYKIPEDAKYTREWMLDYIIGDQNDEYAFDGKKDAEKLSKKYKGSWVLSGYGNRGDVDITSMTLISLGKHHDYYSKEWGRSVEEAIDDAVKWLSSVQRKDGGFDSWFTQNNSESCAQTIIGLCANGIDPTCKEFTKDRNLIENLLRFQQEDGEFFHLLDGSSGVNGMSTEQAFQALIAYRDFYYEKNALYDFVGHELPVEGKVSLENRPPHVSTNLKKNMTVNKSQFDFTLSVSDAEDGCIENFVIKVNGKIVNHQITKYSIKLGKGKNKITVHAEDSVGNKVDKIYIINYQKKKGIKIN